MAFYSVTGCLVNIYIFILHGINLHSSHVLWKYSLSRLHPSVRMELMGIDHDFFSSPENLFGFHVFVGQCYTNQTAIYVCASWHHKSFFKKGRKKKNKDKLFKLSLSHESTIRLFQIPHHLHNAWLIINDEKKTLKNSMRTILSKKKKPTSLWWPHTKVWVTATEVSPG